MFTNVEIQKAKELKSKAWADFKIKYPNADLSRFEVNVYFNKIKHQVTRQQQALKLFLKTRME